MGKTNGNKTPTQEREWNGRRFINVDLAHDK
jgi:hypothetical protein